jgi:hypothetical protein
MMIRRSHWRRMVTSQVIVDQLNAMQSAPIQEELPGVEPEIAEEVTAQRIPVVQNQIQEQSVLEEPIEAQPEGLTEVQSNEQVEVQPEEPVEIAMVPVRRSTRIASGIQPLLSYAMLTKLQETSRKLDDIKEKAKFKAIQKEILQIFKELQAVEPVMKLDIPRDAEILRCFVFLVEKFLANGEFDKIKARLVANGAQQKREMYPNKSSPTASIHGMFTCFALVAYIGEYSVAKIDVKGAYIQTEITGSPIYMKIDKKLTSAVISILPELKEYVTTEGTLYTKLLKALYGCIQSGQLWYAKVKKVLIREGYTPTPTDPCIFRHIVRQKIYFLILHVDDILLFADIEEIERVKTFMMKEFRWITVICDKVQSYLGMNIEMQEHAIILDMHYYIEQLLSNVLSNLTSYKTLATKECFQTAMNNSPLLDIEAKKTFHTIVAKVLYLAKRTRPDLLTVVCFLCTKVKTPTKRDQSKLLRVLGYLQNTKDLKYNIKPREPLKIKTYIDAAFAAHNDSKSLSGMVVFVAGMFVYASSKKQGCVTKSPTESESVALMDNIGLMELFEELVTFLVNDKIATPVIYQDSSLVVSLVTLGGGVTRTKHLRNRMHLAKEAVDLKRLIIKHCRAELMIADGLTKPLEGIDFQQFVQNLMIYDLKKTTSER